MRGNVMNLYPPLEAPVLAPCRGVCFGRCCFFFVAGVALHYPSHCSLYSDIPSYVGLEHLRKRYDRIHIASFLMFYSFRYLVTFKGKNTFDFTDARLTPLLTVGRSNRATGFLTNRGVYPGAVMLQKMVSTRRIIAIQNRSAVR
ncbi:T. brucei spp.-specific protein [Trypanosoma brucei gambiense DAL972]|uniref:T. brucei spp.-specific protein n=1 Tax=Trypanosoma brucei gambiense (strain MHOM/CI/86/DAL972) TaxID=679716 RepID=C9ZV63_TRYB9|nr:T. brucei spp.-specific protein [Trypanosoma brucei gambiense DAL972]CBH13301.1 T. brucei spp.-specific protein [Trypanosoma brucei gambiense DAL972]|eukprot:XP_011775578.1 T. brucei spp.-specific protein [Trypanosoma brucei gambiense DAL972]